MKIYLTAALLFLSACRSGEPPLVKHELRLPEAVQGQGYYAEVKLPFSHLDKRWTVPLNSGFTLSSLNSGTDNAQKPCGKQGGADDAYPDQPQHSR